MTETISFDGLDGVVLNSGVMQHSEEVLCVFETNRFGYFQIACRNGDEVVPIQGEPDLNMFTDAERKYVKEILTIVWRMVHDTTAATERFE